MAEANNFSTTVERQNITKTGRESDLFSDLFLDIADPNVRIRYVSFSAKPGNWLAKILWRFLQYTCTATWAEETIKKEV